MFESLDSHQPITVGCDWLRRTATTIGGLAVRFHDFETGVCKLSHFCVIRYLCYPGKLANSEIIWSFIAIPTTEDAINEFHLLLLRHWFILSALACCSNIQADHRLAPGCCSRLTQQPETRRWTRKIKTSARSGSNCLSGLAPTPAILRSLRFVTVYR